MVNIQERLDLIRYRVDHIPHITVDTRRCEGCSLQPCLTVCPAELFTLSGGAVLFSYEGCLECGTCYVACGTRGNGGVSWSYPRGGYGVCFREA